MKKKILSRDYAFSKLKQFMTEKRARMFASKVQGIHSNPKAFLAMIAGNRSMSDESKVQALKNYIRKHGRRTSTVS